MDESRWPEAIRKFVDEIGSNAERLLIEVGYSAPVWVIKASCPCCQLARMWNIVTQPPLPLPEEVVVPACFQALFK